MTALKPVNSAHFDKTRYDRATRGAAGANARWSKQPPWSAYAIQAKKSSRWTVRWHRRGGTYHQGSVDTHEEADALCAVIRAALRAGLDPPKLPTGRATEEQAPDRSPPELAARRAVMKRVLNNPERCDVCGLLKPCAPCIGEMRTEMHTARRAT